MPVEEPIDPRQRRLAERRIVEALRRFHRAEPLSRDIRTDALVRRVRAHEAADRRPAGHRGAARLELDDAALREVIGGLVAAGRIDRRGHRLALVGERVELDAEMRGRVDRLLAGLRAAGAAPPPAEGSAARIGIPPAVLDQLRAAGTLVRLAPGVEYPRDVLDVLMARIEATAGTAPLTTGRLAAMLHTSRRYAEALLERHRLGREQAGERRRRGRQAARRRDSRAVQ